MKFIPLGIVFALAVVLSIIFVFPLAVWMFKPGFDVMGIGLNPFLAKAITLAFAVPCAYFLVRFVFSWKGRLRLIGFVGIFGVAIVFNILMHFLSQGKCVRVNEFGELETYSGPCAPAEKVKKGTTASDALGCDNKGDLQNRFYSHLTRFGEFKSDFLLSRENLDLIPWFSQQGKPCVFYCVNPGDVISIYIRPGVCRTGEKRRAVDTSIQDLIYRKALEHEESLADQAGREKELLEESAEDRIKRAEAEKRQQEQSERVKTMRAELRENLEKIKAGMAAARAETASQRQRGE